MRDLSQCVIIVSSLEARDRAKKTVDAGKAAGYVWAHSGILEGYALTLEGLEITKAWVAKHYPKASLVSQVPGGKRGAA